MPHNKIGTLIWIGLVALSGLTTACSNSSDDPEPVATVVAEPLDCDVESLQTAAPSDSVVDSAEHLDSPVPHCKVDGHTMTYDPAQNQVNWRVQLPDDFNNRYFFIGLGGGAGTVPTEGEIPTGNPLTKGFATAGTDTGHSAFFLDFSFMSNPAQFADFSGRGAHVSAVATQAITEAYYASDKKIYRYHSGCSGGGNMGTWAVTEYPSDYDGVLMGSPTTRLGPQSVIQQYFIYLGQQVNREPGAYLTQKKLNVADKALTAACDGLDGVEDDMVWDPRACNFDFTTIACPEGTQGDDCLTGPELRTIQALTKGLPGPNGQMLRAGWPMANIGTWSQYMGFTPPPWPADPSGNLAISPGYGISYTFSRAFMGSDFDPLKFDMTDPAQCAVWDQKINKDNEAYTQTLDLSGFYEAGGKAIWYNGASDPSCYATELSEFLATASDEIGGQSTFDTFGRYYEVPGQGHCGGGTGPDDAQDVLMEALINWVEKDEAPGPVVAHRGSERKYIFGPLGPGLYPAALPTTGVDRSFLLCPHPIKSKYNGSGDVLDAVNWSCD